MAAGGVDREGAVLGDVYAHGQFVDVFRAEALGLGQAALAKLPAADGLGEAEVVVRNNFV